MKITLCLFFLLATTLSFGQSKPLEIAKRLLSTEAEMDTTGLYAEELDLSPRGLAGLIEAMSPDTSRKGKIRPDFTKLKATYSFTFRSFEYQPEKQIINVTAKDSANQGFDFYLNFTKHHQQWQLAGINRLERSVVAEIWFVEQYKGAQIDSVLNSEDPYKPFQSRTQFDAVKKVHDLVLNFDDSIVAYFKSNKDALVDLKKAFYKQKHEHPEDRTMFKYNTQYRAYVKSGLCINDVKEHDPESDDYLAFNILGNYHGVVGYFHAKNASKIPMLLKSGDVFFVREIEEGWYMYKGNRK